MGDSDLTPGCEIMTPHNQTPCPRARAGRDLVLTPPDLPPGHEGAVRGVASTGLVHQLLSAGADSQLRFWRLKTGQLLQSVPLDAPAARLVLHRERWVGMVVVRRQWKGVVHGRRADIS